MKELFEKVKQWLENLSSPCFDIQGFQLTVLGESTALAVKYSQTVDGRTDTSYYVVAPLPKKYRHGNIRKNGTELYGEGKHFYVVCYFPEGYAREDVKQFHPFGPNYIMREIGDLAQHRIPGELPHTLSLQLTPLD